VDCVPLGRTGIRVSRFCLGAMMFGAMGNRDRRDCVRIIHRALDAGINFIDTADVYSRGESEEIVGEALRDRRDSVVVATKFFGPMGDDPNRRGGSRRWILRAVEESLRRLRTETIDLYQMHRFDDETDLEESLGALTDLMRAGKIRAIGTSTFTADRLVEAQWIAERRGLARPRCEQSPYSILRREIERTVLPACQRYGLGVIVWSPLEGGWLTGRYLAPEDFRDDTRIVALGRRWGGFDLSAPENRRRLELVRQLDRLAKKAGLPLARLAVAWTLEHPAVSAAIIGPRTAEQLEDLLPAAGLVLGTDLLDEIDRLVPPGTNANPFDPSSDPSGLKPARRRRAEREARP
jgi:aryl-alcohol dehydrogenase (NADP+)